MTISKTAFRYIPANSSAILRKNVDAIVYTTERDVGTSRFVAVGYRGNQSKSTFNYWFKTEEARAQYIAQFFDQVASAQKIKADQKVARAALLAKGHGLTVGDVVYTSWGYEQTNVDFYEVAEVTSNKSVLVHPINKVYTATGHMSGTSVPVAVRVPAGKAFRAFWNGYSLQVGEGRSKHGASKWEGRPQHESSYA